MKRFTLSIPKPCHEKWEAFKPTTRGGYCSSCQKEVIDFSTWDEDRIRKYFLHTRSTICGRFKEAQLKTYRSEQFSIAQQWIPASLLSFTLLLATPEVKAQNPVSHTSERQDSENHIIVKQGKINVALREIRGTVKSSEDSSLLPGVNVFLKGTDVGTQTDGNGAFSLEIKNPSENDTLVFSFIGFEVKEIAIHGKEKIDVTLKSDETLLGEMVVVGGVCNRPWSVRNI